MSDFIEVCGECGNERHKVRYTENNELNKVCSECASEHRKYWQEDHPAVNGGNDLPDAPMGRPDVLPCYENDDLTHNL